MIGIGNIIKHGGESGGVGKHVAELARIVSGQTSTDEMAVANALAASYADHAIESEWSGERRPADGESVWDGVAVVQRLKGLTLSSELTGQLLPEEYELGNRADTVYAIAEHDDYFHVELGAGAADCPAKYVYIYRKNETDPVIGHKYVIISKFRSNTYDFYAQKQIGNATSRGSNRTGEWVTEGWVRECATNSYVGITYYGNIFTLREMTNTPYLDFSKESVAYDLTDMFGAGNEPETAEAFAELLGCSSLEEVLHLGGGLRSSKPVAIVSKDWDETELGRMEFDVESIEDGDGNQLFPDGELHSVGDLYDEIDYVNHVAIKRVSDNVGVDGNYYELAEPIVVSIPEVTNWYAMTDEGIEVAIVGENSVQLRADIAYRIVPATDILPPIISPINPIIPSL